MNDKILRIPREHFAETVAVLSAAFFNYPVMRFVCRTSGLEYEKDLKALISFFCELRYLRNAPVLGIRHDGTLIAVALVNEPASEPPPLPQELLSQLKDDIGEDAFRRLVLYEEKSSEPEPKDAHYFLGMIGVHPAYRGMGYGKPLLDAVKQLSIEDPNCSGVCLSTEDPRNVGLYERFGYRVIAEVDIEDLHSWIMFLSTKATT